MSLSLIYRLFLSLSCWRFSTMPLCYLFPLPPTFVASPLGWAWLLINLFLLDLLFFVWSTSSRALPSYPSDPSMSIPPFTSDLSLQFWFDSILFCLFFVFFFFIFSPTFFLVFFACNKVQSSLFNPLIYILMLCEVFVLWSKSLSCGCEWYLDFWVEDDKFRLEILCSQSQEIIATYALNYVCLVQIWC